MGEMKVNINTLRKAEEQLMKARRELLELLPRYSRVQSELRNTWDGAFAQAYMDMLAVERLKGEKALHEIELLAGYVASTIKKMEEYDRQWAARMLALAQEAAQRLGEAAREANKPIKDVVKTSAQQTPATNLGAMVNQGIPSLGR